MSRCRHPFVAVEGLDGSGKTTLRKGLFRIWEDAYGTTPLCLLTTNFLAADRVPDLIDGKFHPVPANRDAYLAALADDKRRTLTRLVRPHRAVRPVLTDRWLLSDMAFFAVMHGADPADTYRSLTAGITDRPDVTLLLDLPTDDSLRRARDRPGNETRLGWDTPDVQTRVREVYHAISTDPSPFPLLGDVVRLDARASRPEVLNAAWDALRARGLLAAEMAGT